MVSPAITFSDYELADFGGGRKLERFGHYVLDRPAPAAELATLTTPELWSRADARFERGSGERGAWRAAGGAALPPRWTIRRGQIVLELKTTPFGHLGVFPEQAANWDWLAEQVAAAGGPVKVLNLFAYTGASTLAAAAAGAEVVHVDAARNIVAWARRNAELSSLTAAPVRWITDDAVAFVRRELKRGHRYNGIVLDPPSYGHGAKGETWKLADDLAGLLADCARLLDGEHQFLLLTCHTPGFGAQELREMLLRATGKSDVECGPLLLATTSGRSLESGAMARFSEGV